jgi:site-specific DNA-methyltransferase (adenine-specific)
MTAEPYWSGEGVTVHHGDCIQVMATMPDNSVDAIVTDPPYNLSFMSKTWDRHDSPQAFQAWCQEWATEALRVLKPGGHALVFGGTRTFHRLTCGMEDAGFEIRDSIAWLYGSGFPKSLDVGKAIDKTDATDVRRIRNLTFSAWMRSTGITAARINELTGTNMGSHYITAAAQTQVATADMFDLLRQDLPDVPAHIEGLVSERTVESEAFKSRKVICQVVHPVGNKPGGASLNMSVVGMPESADVTAPATDAAKRWEGWGTALKPAFEPIVCARKPLVGTVAANVLAYDTGALNIDASRIGAGQDYYDKCASVVGLDSNRNGSAYGEWTGPREDSSSPAGRWPANVLLDEPMAAVLDQQESDASRFFYTAKATADERVTVNGVSHPTVKPLALLKYLVRLVTPPGGAVLDMFAGSGTTLEAAMREGFTCIGIEQEADYLPLILARVQRPMNHIMMFD